MTSSQFSRSLENPRRCRPLITPALVVCVSGFIALSSASLARAQDDGDSGWGKAKAKPAEKAPAKPANKSVAPAQDNKSLKDEGKELFGKSGSGGSGGAGNDSGGDARGWAVVIAAFRGEDREAAAAKALAQVRGEGGIPEAYVARRREAMVIAVGDFSSPDDERAKSELTRIQKLEINGNRPFASAMLAPPLDFKMAGSMPQYNLVKAKQLFGEQALYTLQVAAYGRLDLDRPGEKDLVEARAAAEQAVANLRQEGEQAWYYHGPSMSMVCVGVYDQTDFDPQLPNLKSTKLRETQKRHPYNLYNGAGLKIKRKGERTQTLQPSSLVEIPKN